MDHTTRHTHSWSHLLARFAQDMGTSDYRFGPLGFSQADGPTIVAELLDDGRALGLTVDLEHTPDASQLEVFLVANRVENAQDAGVYAIYPANNNTLLFYRRLEDPSPYEHEDLLREIQDFAQTAQAALDALPHALQGAAFDAPAGDAAATHADTFRHIWSDFALAQGLGRELPAAAADGSFILSLDGERHVFVRPDTARGCVVLTTPMALLPLFNDNESAVWLGLLEAHTLGQATGGTVFAIDADEQELIAWRSLPLAGLDAYALNDAIDSLAEVARFYTEALQLEAVPV